ncbi:hypothetical protein SAMN04487939_10152 [Lysobacter sp. yr284]|uniref:hypothetical protein n=1 Tax=Lysobacter sp. yr284 TaxID=1761791 RepID=UPI0008952EFB|nr:hypothetical protein [Lysobacter sp. yr284]SDY17126.1 hypothetical protein SAMN04487939_10152 [Lysobacter sp. yr284]
MMRKVGFIACLGLGWALWGGAARAQMPGPGAVVGCPTDAIVADVVAIDHPMVFNRLGAQNVNWMMYALRHDLVVPVKQADGSTRWRPLDYSPEGQALFDKVREKSSSREIALRPDLRPRPLVLRVPAGRALYVRLTNLLAVYDSPPNTTTGNPYNSDPNPLGAPHPMNQAAKDAPGLSGDERIFHIDDQVFSRSVGFHPQGLELIGSEQSDSSYAGRNKSSLAAPGESTDYCFRAPAEGAFLVSNPGAAFGGEGSAGDSGVGLFGAVAVQPTGAAFYRAQVTEEELRLATRPGPATGAGQPIVDYEAKYPGCDVGGVWCEEGKGGLPVLNMLDGNRIVHGDVNAIVMSAANKDGRFDPKTYPLERANKRNPSVPNRLEPFREFVSIYHDENAATQAFPYFFEHPELGHTLHGVRDAFMINYGSGGVGAEIIANRLKAGPMQDCIDCAYEEFFLSAFAVGDAAMLVDKPVNLRVGRCQPEFVEANRRKQLGQSFDESHYKGFRRDCVWNDDKREPPFATAVYYPHDPANVHHSYIGDFVKFRNIHAGKEQHIFHLHNHQWLFNPNDDNANYIDAQGIGPGSGYTYEIAFGGSGNRNKTVGDAIFHCHFYPHFAQGMWYMWRNHDVFEAGTRLKVSEAGKDGFHAEPYGLRDGTPAPGARALPDGEILAGAPIPAVVPLPGKALPPMPGDVHLEPKSTGLGSKAVLTYPNSKQLLNPGYPFWVAGVTEHHGIPASIGHRPTTPPLDMVDTFADPVTGIKTGMGGFDGGLPRHALGGYAEGGKDDSVLDRLSAKKHIKRAKPIYFDERGTGLEQVAMEFHAKRAHPSYRYDRDGNVGAADFIVNGAPAVPGAPYNEPCIDDRGQRLTAGGDGAFFGGKALDAMISVKQSLPGGIEFGATNPRVYKGANIQLDVTFNKLGYHYPQQRILSLWEDVAATLDGKRAPEPLVLRMNTFDCAMYQHTNLVPKDFYADDYQITTPTDVIGQHIHLPKWDLTSADGSANGWNYEDGTFSPGAVRERIAAINHWNKAEVEAGRAPVATLDGAVALSPRPHPFFGAAQFQREDCHKLWDELDGDFEAFEKAYGAYPRVCDWLGARTTLQRWFSDPVVNAAGVHRGLGITFTHDHLGPSTHQQLGLYATMLTEPPGSMWYHNESGARLYDTASRNDGGPTTWQAIITGKDRKPINVDGDKRDDSHREFFLQFGDFQHAYLKGKYVGVNKDGVPYEYAPEAKAGPDSYLHAIHPSVRKPVEAAAGTVAKDIFKYDSHCPGGPQANKLPGAVYFADKKPLRPCPEAISADDIGMMVVNYRNEPLAARVYDDTRGAQHSGFGGDLAYAFQSRTDRAIDSLNTVGGDAPYAPLTRGVLAGDPFTPILRTYSGDLIRVKVQAGSHEHEHNGSINGLAWLQGGSGYGQAPHSGWRNAQNTGLSEQFTFAARIVDYATANNQTDRLYTVDSGQDGLWSGVWGVLRSSNRRDPKAANDLQVLPSNPRPTLLATREGKVAFNDCPLKAPVRSYHVVAVRANEVLSKPSDATIPNPSGAALNPGGGTLVYNPRNTKITLQEVDANDRPTGRRLEYGSGPLHDPTAVLLLREEDVLVMSNRDGSLRHTLRPGRPLEPLVLRVAAGECAQVVLHNRLPRNARSMPELDGHTSLSGIVRHGFATATPSQTSFNNNHIRASNHIGLHPQMVHYDVQSGDGSVVGVNKNSLVPPGRSYVYQWYAGALDKGDPHLNWGTGASSAVCQLVDPERIKQSLTLLSAFPNNPRLRPLGQIYDQALFDENQDAIYARTRQIGSSGRARAAAAAPPPPQINAGTRADLNQVAQTNNCMDTDKTFNVPEPQWPDDEAQVADAAPVGEDDSIAEVFDRSDQLRRRSLCSIPPESPGKESVYTEVRNGFKAAILKNSEAGSGPVTDAQAEEFAKQLTASFLFEVDGLDDGVTASPAPEGRAARTALSWRAETYPGLDEQTTRLIRLVDTCRFVPVEYGGSNLTPPDRIKQGQKAAVGALIVEPQRASWSEYHDDRVIDRQNPGPSQQNQRASRATATVSYPVNVANVAGSRTVQRTMRDFAIVHQKALNFRYGDGSAVANLAAEREDARMSPFDTAPEDAQDAGHMAINYGSEPLWFRFGLAPDAPFGRDGFGGATQAWQAFSNKCCGNGGSVGSATAGVGEPYVPIMTVAAGMETRLRVLMPTGIGRGTIFSLHGHVWPRDPYLAEKVDDAGYPKGGGPGEWGLAARCIGRNALQMELGGQESVTAMAHYDVALASAGGRDGVVGDYLWRDMGGFGISNGLWGIVRVTETGRVQKPVPLSSWCLQ